MPSDRNCVENDAMYVWSYSYSDSSSSWSSLDLVAVVVGWWYEWYRPAWTLVGREVNEVSGAAESSFGVLRYIDELLLVLTVLASVTMLSSWNSINKDVCINLLLASTVIL